MVVQFLELENILVLKLDVNNCAVETCNMYISTCYLVHINIHSELPTTQMVW